MGYNSQENLLKTYIKLNVFLDIEEYSKIGEGMLDAAGFIIKT